MTSGGSAGGAHRLEADGDPGGGDDGGTEEPIADRVGGEHAGVEGALGVDDVGQRVEVGGDLEPAGRAVEGQQYAGGCLLAMSVDDPQWPVMVLAQVGVDFEVLSPDELRVEVARVSECFGRAVG
ncbi:hypothetical protein NSZ01_14470 [Nocardioides szechwanensis]|nr:hypothetical protein NSZ01_14470 [Nocardioides szechwanensis]